MTDHAVDLFSGIGWGFACAELGIDEHGIDNEPAVAKTREALGWSTTCADILALDPSDWAGIDGLIGSPPCQSWSRAGKGAGLDDPRGQLVWQPLVWALATRPRWVALEQVPEARGAYELIAHRLREVGYHAEVFAVSAETMGVPQTRLRVFMLAHHDRPVMRPPLTHQRFRKGRARVEPADMLGHLPWVSMAEALGKGFLDRLALTLRGHSETGSGHGMDGGSGARATVDAAVREGRWMLDRHQNGAPLVDPDERPCPTITAAAMGKNVWGWSLSANDQPRAGTRDMSEPAPTILTRSENASWALTRPSTTVCADPRVSPPVHHDGSQSAGAVPFEEAGSDKPIALTEEQGCILMAFPAAAPAALHGNKEARWRLIGNAVCPPVARAVLTELVR